MYIHIYIDVYRFILYINIYVGMYMNKAEGSCRDGHAHAGVAPGVESPDPLTLFLRVSETSDPYS